MSKKLVLILNIVLIVLSVSVFIALAFPAISADVHNKYFNKTAHKATYSGYEAFFGINNTSNLKIQVPGLAIFALILMIIILACAIAQIIVKRNLVKNITAVIAMLTSLLIGIFFFNGSSNFINVVSSYKSDDLELNMKPTFIICGIIFMVICVINLIKLLFTPQPVVVKEDDSNDTKEEIERLKEELFEYTKEKNENELVIDEVVEENEEEIIKPEE